MKQSAIKKRLNYNNLVLSMISFCFVLGSIGGGLYAIKFMEGSVNKISQHSLPALKSINLIHMNQKRMKETVYKSFITGPDEREDVLEEFTDQIKNTSRQLGDFQKNGEDLVSFEMLSTFKTVIENYITSGKKVIYLSLDGKRDQAENSLKGFNESFDVLSSHLEKTTELVQDGINIQSQKSEQDLETFLLVGFSLLGVCFLFAPLIFYYTHIRPSAFLNHLLTLTNEMEKELDELRKKSQVFSGISQNLIQNNDEQTNAIEDAHVCFEEIAYSLKKNNEKIKQLLSYSDQHVMISQRAKDKSKKIMDSMSVLTKNNHEIIQQTQSLTQQVSELFDLIQNISPKAKMVNDIFYQCKNLFLHATTEALKAGEWGSGFSVVAEEIGNLAVTVGRVASEITETLNSSTRKIAEIDKLNKDMIEEMIPDAKSKFELSTLNIKKYAFDLEEIITKVSTQSEMMLDMSKSLQEQLRPMGELSNHLHSIEQKQSSYNLVSEKLELTKDDLELNTSRFGHVFTELNFLVNGKKEDDQALSTAPHEISLENVLPIKKHEQSHWSNFDDQSKKVVGLDFDISKDKKSNLGEL